MVTDLTLMLHLFSIEHPEEHNCEQCPICQQILTSPEGLAQGPEPAVGNISQFQNYVEFPPSTYVEQFYLSSFNPRPPPYIP
jgi:hypothetical protein